MSTLLIFDPAMCCSTGVCGPSVDPKLVKLAADVAFLQSSGIHVQRFNLGHQPKAFTDNPRVLSEMGAEAEHLPIFIVGGDIMAKGRYPERAELADWFGIEAGVTASKPLMNLRVADDKKCCGGDECC